MRIVPRKLGLAIVGAGRVGLIRGEVASRHPEVEWIGIAEKRPERAPCHAAHRGSRAVRAVCPQAGRGLLPPRSCGEA